MSTTSNPLASNGQFQPQMRPFEVLSCPRAYIRAWIVKNGIEIGAKGYPQNLDQRVSSMFEKLYLDYLEQVRAYNIDAQSKGAAKAKTIRKDVLESAFEEYREKMAEKALTTIREKLTCSTEDLATLNQFVEAITGFPDSLTTSVFAHWIWMIKRKLSGKSVIDHIMPVLFGPQGSGKTVGIQRLIKPMQEWTLELKMNALTDDRNYYALEENFVVIFDELQNADRSDVDVLKNIITTRETTARKMRTNIVDKVKQNCSFIGSTNRPVDEQIFDTSGMRRFYQVNVLPKCNWEAVNNINYEAIWQGVDENREDGYLKEVADNLSVHQEALRAKDQFESFMEELMDGIKDNPHGDLIPASTLYFVYFHWAKGNGYQPMNSNWVGRKMKNLGFPSSKQHQKGNSFRAYYMPTGAIASVERVNKSHQ
jgi:hypothetical protein